MKPIVEKVLNSGLVDKSVAQMMEAWGYIPEGTSDKLDEEKLKAKTHEEMKKTVEEVAEIIEQEHALRETYLDLNRLRWPVDVSIRDEKGKNGNQLVYSLSGVVDRMGRYYFRIQDVKPEWFVPGYVLVRNSTKMDSPNMMASQYFRILEKQVLYIEEQPVCLQVSVEEL